MQYILLFILGIAALLQEIVAKSTPEKVKSQPEQIHIAFGDKINDITVTWSTRDKTEDTIVRYGEGKLDKKEKGEHKLFVDGGSNKKSQWIHNVKLKNLKFNTSYVYKVGSNSGWSKQFSFKTPPSGEDWPVNIVILGDLGLKNDLSRKSIEQDVQTGRYDFVIHVGDFAYNLDDDEGDIGDQFMNRLQPIAANYPYMVCPGNHETAYNYSHYKNRFSMPGFSSSMFYSFDVGPIHFISLNTEAYYNNTYYPGSIPPNNGEMATQYHWLEKDLIEANKPENRQKRPWIIAYGHRPFYCSNNDDGCGVGNYYHRVGIPQLGGYALEPLLYKYTVDLEIWAHEHTYERMWPVYQKKVYNGSYDQPYVNPGAPVQFTSGSAGSKEGTDNFDPPYAWTAFQSSDYGYTRFKAHNKTHLYVEQVATHKRSNLQRAGGPSKIDEFWLVKHHRKAYQNY